MSTITIPAREVEKDDVIDLGGQPITIAWSNSTYREDLWLLGIGTKYAPKPVFGLLVGADDVFTVIRPDPDAELIEVMAKGIFMSDGGRPDVWEGAERQPAYATNARAALTAAREAGLL